jgi:hypothetical protein
MPVRRGPAIAAQQAGSGASQVPGARQKVRGRILSFINYKVRSFLICNTMSVVVALSVVYSLLVLAHVGSASRFDPSDATSLAAYLSQKEPNAHVLADNAATFITSGFDVDPRFVAAIAGAVQNWGKYFDPPAFVCGSWNYWNYGYPSCINYASPAEAIRNYSAAVGAFVGNRTNAGNPRDMAPFSRRANHDVMSH